MEVKIMSKKNKKKEKSIKKQIKMIQEFDNSMSDKYSDIMDEISEYQYELNQAEKKARKKMKKKLKKDKSYVYDNRERINARKKIVNRMESNDFFNRIENSLSQTGSIIIMICRLVAALIAAILSFEPIKALISNRSLTKMNKIYNFAMSVGR